MLLTANILSSLGGAMSGVGVAPCWPREKYFTRTHDAFDIV
jgi:hypothetical protein